MKKKIDPKVVKLLEQLNHLRKKDFHLAYNHAQVFEDKTKKRKGNRKQNNEVEIRENGEL